MNEFSPILGTEASLFYI